jgi:hypothetical protein
VSAPTESTLAGTRLFGDLDDADLADVARLTEPFEVRAGDLLIRQGEQAEHLYVLEAGCLEVVARLPGDREMPLSRLGRATCSASCRSSPAARGRLRLAPSRRRAGCSSAATPSAACA